MDVASYPIMSLKCISRGAHPDFFIVGGGGVADPKTMYDLYFVLKIML